MRGDRSVLADLIDGAIAGAVATWVMGKLTTYLYDHENRTARQREDEAREGKTAYAVAAEKAARLAGTELTEDQRTTYGSAIHWGLGIGVGALYGVLRPRLRSAELAHGLAFGTSSGS